MFRRIWKAAVSRASQAIRRLASTRLLAGKRDTPQRQAIEEPGARASSRDLDLAVMGEAIRLYPGHPQNQEVFWRAQRRKSRASFFRCKRLYTATRGDGAEQPTEADRGDEEATSG